MSEITEAQLQELECRHFAVLLNRNSLESCRVDGETWPCAVNQLTKALRAARAPRIDPDVCNYCGQHLGVYGWLRPSVSSVGPHALCNRCLREYVAAQDPPP